MIKPITILLIFSFWNNLTAQEPMRYTTKQGLPTNHIYDLVEDDNGIIWMATMGGVVKYNGENFKTFTIKDGLPNNDIWAVDVDYQGRVWYFSNSAYQGYIKNDSVHKFSTKDKETIKPLFVFKSKNSIWFGDNKLFSLAKSDRDSNAYLKNQIGLNGSTSIYKEFSLEVESPYFYNPETKEYVFFQKNKVLVFDYNKKLKQKIPATLPVQYGVWRNRIGTMALCNQIGFFARDNGVYFFNFKTYTIHYKTYKTLFGIDGIPDFFEHKSTKANIQLSVPGHLIILDNDLNRIAHYTYPKALGRMGFKDSKGNIWLTDFTKGLSLLTNAQLNAEYYLQGEKVQAINEIDGHLMAGVYGKGFFEFDFKSNSFKNTIPDPSHHSLIYGIKSDSINQYDFLISHIQTYVLKDGTRKLLKYTANNDPLTTVVFTTNKDIIYKDKHFYIARSGGVIKIDQEGYADIVQLKQGLLRIAHFKNQIYVAGTSGLYALKNDSLVRPKASHPLRDMSTLSLLPTQKHLYVGTDGRGVYAYTKNSITHLKATDDLNIKQIIKKGDILWLATQKGVKKVKLNVNDIGNSTIASSFYEADGLLQNNTHAIYIQDSLLYACSDIGISKLNINSSIYKKQPKLYFKTKKDTLDFRGSDRDNISLSFSVNDYKNQDHINYTYRLLPNQKQWTSTTTKTLNFNNLSPQLYTLEVKATDQHNNTNIQKQYLNVIPKWYESTLAWVWFLLTFLGLLGFGFYLIKKQIQRKAQEKAEQEKRVAGLELQALRSQMNPHFVHNSLNAIQYFIQRNEVKLSEEYLSKFAHLIRLFFEYSRQQTIAIGEEIELLTHYLDIEKLRFEEKLNYKITVCENIDTDEQRIPSMLLQPIVENAVNHGLFHKNDMGNVTVVFKQLEVQKYQVTITDDGIGINKAKQLFNASSKNYQSNSSAVLKERLELLNKSKNWDITYNMQDISEIDTSKTGTVATLIFKNIL